MSLRFIHDFQTRIYHLLAGKNEIRSKIDRIYLSVVQDAKYPFLLISVLGAKNLSKLEQDIYEVEFEISAFARDKTQGLLVRLADEITKVITATECHFAEYIIAGLSLTEVRFIQSQDLVTTKLAIGYRALLKKEIRG